MVKDIADKLIFFLNLNDNYYVLYEEVYWSQAWIPDEQTNERKWLVLNPNCRFRSNDNGEMFDYFWVRGQPIPMYTRLLRRAVQ